MSRGVKRGARRLIPDQTIELDYALGWYLSELAHPFNGKFAFKGNTALRRCHIGEYRFSEDLDFIILSDDPFETMWFDFFDLFSRAKSGFRNTPIQGISLPLGSKSALNFCPRRLKF